MVKNIKFNDFVNSYVENPDRWHLFPNCVKYVNRPMSKWNEYEIQVLEKYMKQAKENNINLLTFSSFNTFLDKYGERETYQFSFIDRIKYAWFCFRKVD